MFSLFYLDVHHKQNNHQADVITGNTGIYGGICGIKDSSLAILE